MKIRTSPIASRLFNLSCVLMFGPLLGVSQAQQLPSEVIRYADIVLYNGHVLTMDRDQPSHQRGPGRGASRSSDYGGGGGCSDFENGWTQYGQDGP